MGKKHKAIAGIPFSKVKYLILSYTGDEQHSIEGLYIQDRALDFNDLKKKVSNVIGEWAVEGRMDLYWNLAVLDLEKLDFLSKEKMKQVVGQADVKIAFSE